MKIFGFEITRKVPSEDLKSFIEPANEDGAVVVETHPNSVGGVGYNLYIDMEGSAKNEAELVQRYRSVSIHPEVRRAIDDIVNESIIDNGRDSPLSINTDDLDFSESIKTKIRDEFDEVIKLFDVKNKAYDHFLRWYVDGRSYYHVIVDQENIDQGIKEIRYIDPRKIRKVREVEKNPSTSAVGLDTKKVKNEYYVYFDQGFTQQNASAYNSGSSSISGVKISKDSIIHCTSGVINEDNTLVLSHLHKALKPINQLKILEDAVVIYRVSRAPERLIFYIDVAGLPKAKAEQHIRNMMQNYKNKLVYNSSTGEMSDERRHMSITENFWLPRREGRNTEITPLPGGQNLGEMEDVEYFKRKMYRALDVPISRLESESNFSLGRQSEISRDEIKFSKLIGRLRSRFSKIFLDALKIQLLFKNIITLDDWENIIQDIRIEYNEDNFYQELKEIEIWRERLSVANEMEQFVGNYVSSNWIKRNIFRFTDEEIVQMDKEIKESGDDEDDFEDDDDNHNNFKPQTSPFEKISKEKKNTNEKVEDDEDLDKQNDKDKDK